MKISDYRSAVVPIPIGTTEITYVFPIGINMSIILLPELSNVILKKIIIDFSSSVNEPVIKSFSYRFRIRNRDISLATNLAGNILNPISGPFNASLQKDTIQDIMLTKKKNHIDFYEGIQIGGVQIVSASLSFYSPTTSIFNPLQHVCLFYE